MSVLEAIKSVDISIAQKEEANGQAGTFGMKTRSR
jgi:hypothetical protein